MQSKVGNDQDRWPLLSWMFKIRIIQPVRLQWKALIEGGRLAKALLLNWMNQWRKLVLSLDPLAFLSDGVLLMSEEGHNFWSHLWEYDWDLEPSFHLSSWIIQPTWEIDESLKLNKIKGFFLIESSKTERHKQAKIGSTCPGRIFFTNKLTYPSSIPSPFKWIALDTKIKLKIKTWSNCRTTYGRIPSLNSWGSKRVRQFKGY